MLAFAVAAALAGCGGEGAIALAAGEQGGAAGGSAGGQGASAQAGSSGAGGAAGASGSSGGSGGVGPGAQLFPFVNGACGACVASQCEAEMMGCRASTSCLAIMGCFSQCEASTTACVVKCDNTPWRADDVAARARACQVSRCGEACAISCGGVLAKTEDCASCGAERCCAEGSACGASLGCQRLDACRLRCDPADQPCADACDGQFPDGKSQREAYRSCLKQGCGDECARGYIVPTP